MQAPNFWILTNNSPFEVGNNLNDVRIRKIGGGYVLKADNVPQPFAATAATSPPFDFHNVLIGDVVYDFIRVLALPSSGSENGGVWRVLSREAIGDPTDGDFTAQAGAGADEDAEAASSAHA